MSKKYFENKIREDYEKLTNLLISKDITISTMESCTAGQIASLITDTEGASAVFPGAFITYSNMAKIQSGVSGELIEKFSVYSEEIAAAMAEACAKAYGTDIGIGVTGSFGNPDSANPQSSAPGQVYYAICINGRATSYQLELEPQPSRLAYKLAVAKEVFDTLIILIT